MKLKAEITKEQLIELGFYEPDLDDEDDEDFSTWFEKSCLAIFCLGHGRRGQSYYIGFEKETRKMLLYASKPDGDGCHTEVGDILIKLIQNNFIEL